MSPPERLRQGLRRAHWVLNSQLGLDPLLAWRAFRALPRFLRDLSRFRRLYRGALSLQPCLHDRGAEAGATSSEYFWQDLLVARWVHEHGPRRHLDVGSRIDGFVAHVASFREIEVLDVRPVSSRIPGVRFQQADLMDVGQVARLDPAGQGICDSLSCLHALEHFGLGRYGDPLDPEGYRRGLTNLAALLEPGGRLYLSTPIGRQRVEFNANWVFDPRTLLGVATDCGLVLSNLVVIAPGQEPGPVAGSPATFEALAEAPYQLGLFTFEKAPAGGASTGGSR